MTNIEELKLNLRESDCPFFTDGELELYLSKNGNDIRRTTRECLMVKAQDTTLQVSGLSCSDTSKYFLRLATMYESNNSRVL